MKIRYRSALEGNYLVVEEIPAAKSTYPLRMLEENRIPGFLPLQIRTVNGETQLLYEITSMQTMRQLYTRRRVDGAQLFAFVCGLRDALSQGRGYLLESTDLVANPDEIYMDPGTGVPAFLCIPGFSGHEDAFGVPSSWNKVGEFLLQNLDDTDGIAAQIGLAFYHAALGERGSFSAALQALVQDVEARILKEPRHIARKEAAQGLFPEQPFQERAGDFDGAHLPEAWDADRRRDGAEGPAEHPVQVEAVRMQAWTRTDREDTGSDRQAPPWEAPNRHSEENVESRGGGDLPEAFEGSGKFAQTQSARQKKQKKRSGEKRRKNKEKIPQEGMFGKDVWFLFVCLAAVFGDAGLWLYFEMDLTQTGGMVFATIALLWLLYRSTIGPKKEKQGVWAKETERMLSEEEAYLEALYADAYTPKNRETTRHQTGAPEEADQGRRQRSEETREENPATRVLLTASEGEAKSGEGQGLCLRAQARDLEDLHLPPGTWVIGKQANQTDFQIRRDVVSRIHAQISCGETGVFLTDLNSRNGTFLNEKRMEPNETRAIQKGDRVRFADAGYLAEPISEG